MSEVDTGSIEVFVHDSKTGSTTKYFSITNAAETVNVARITAQRALVSGYEVNNRYTFSLTSDINVMSVTSPHRGIPVFVYKNGTLLNGSPFGSYLKAASGIGISYDSLYKYLDTDTIVGDYCFYTEEVSEEEMATLTFKRIPLPSKNAKTVWAYQDGKLVEGSPFNSQEAAGRALGLTGRTVGNNINTGKVTKKAPGYKFYSEQVE